LVRTASAKRRRDAPLDLQNTHTNFHNEPVFSD
jgi:hypothetical protein